MHYLLNYNDFFVFSQSLWATIYKLIEFLRGGRNDWKILGLQFKSVKGLYIIFRCISVPSFHKRCKNAEKWLGGRRFWTLITQIYYIYP